MTSASSDLMSIKLRFVTAFRLSKRKSVGSSKESIHAICSRFMTQILSHMYMHREMRDGMSGKCTS